MKDWKKKFKDLEKDIIRYFKLLSLPYKVVAKERKTTETIDITRERLQNECNFLFRKLSAMKKGGENE